MTDNLSKQLVLSLIKQGVVFQLNEGAVKLAGNLDALTPDIKRQLKQHKADILTYLQSRQQTPQSGVIQNVANNEPVPLSWAQQRLWFIHQFAGESSQYNLPFAFTVEGSLDFKACQQAIKSIIDRHQLLNTRFIEQDGIILQQPEKLQHLDNVFKNIDLSTLPEKDQQQRIQQFVRDEITTSFMLTTSDISEEACPLIRINLIKCSDTTHVLLFTLHHLVSDGASGGVLVNEFTTAYRQLTQNEPVLLPDLSVSYQDFAVWQRDLFAKHTFTQSLSYWKEQLADLPDVHDLVLDAPGRIRPATQQFSGQAFNRRMSGSVVSNLRSVCRDHQVTLFALLETVYALLVSRFSRNPDIVIGSPVSGRDQKVLEPLIGCFVNTVLFRTQIDPQASVKDLITDNQQTILDGLTHQYVPFEMLVEQLEPGRSLSYNPLFQLFFSLQHREQQAVSLPGLTLSAIEQPVEKVKFDLALQVTEQTEGSLILNWSWDTGLFSAHRIEQMAESYDVLVNRIVEALAKTPDTPVASLSLLSAQQLAAARRYQEPEAVKPGHYMLERFEQQVKQQPDTIALVAATSDESTPYQLTYRDLNNRAEQFARYLQQQVKHQLHESRQPLIAILLPRSADMLIAMLAVAKAGYAWIPLDSNYPQERLNYQLEQAGCRVVISTKDLQQQFTFTTSHPLTWLDISDVNQAESATFTAPVERQRFQETSLAYVIYTSGSTGKPKGVSISHQNVNALIDWALTAFRDEELARVGAGTSICFDLSTFELFVPLSAGTTVVLLDHGLDLLNQPGLNLSLINTVPSIMKALLDGFSRQQQVLPDSVQTINLAGEALTRDLVDRIWQETGVSNINNLYGPSEDTTYSTWAPQQRNEKKVPTIGKPLVGTGAILVDEQYLHVAVGQPGELLLSGSGVSSGYLNSSALTSDRFVVLHGQRFYRTGDLVTLNEQGDFEYLGRIDNQVKVRGFRIETAEVETQLRQLTGVQDAAVAARDLYQDGVLHLVAWVVGQGMRTTDIQQSLAATLPDFMVPSHLTILDGLPQTANGKIDYKRLPSPDAQQTDVSHRQPSTPVEQLLHSLWMQYLPVNAAQKIGIDDNFFACGGDSILSIQLVSAARKHQLPLTVKAIFEHQTIASLAVWLEQQPSLTIAVPQHPETGHMPLLPMQQYFADLIGKTPGYVNPDHYNQAVLLNVPANLAPDELQLALNQLLQRHDSLTAGFMPVSADCPSARLVFQVRDEFPLVLKHQSEHGLDFQAWLRQQCDDDQASLSLAEHRLIKAVLYVSADRQHARLLLICHHWLVDGVSWRILLSDLNDAFNSPRQENRLKPKTHSIRFWQQQLQSFSEQIPASTKEYWESVWPDDWTLLAKPATQVTGMSSEQLVLATELTQDLTQQCQAISNQQNLLPHVLIATLSMAIEQLKQRSNEFEPALHTLMILMEGHGRELDALEQAGLTNIDITDTVGWFTSLWPLRIDLPQDANEGQNKLLSLIRQVKQSMQCAPDNGLSYSLLRSTNQAIQRSEQLSQAILFNYLGRFDGDENSAETAAKNKHDTLDTLFSMAAESPGVMNDEKNIHPELISCNGLIANGQLSINISYHTPQLSSQTMQQLSALWQQAIRQFVTAMQSVENHQHLITQSDFPLATLDNADFDRLLSEQTGPDLSISRLYPATAMQQGLLFHTQLDEAEENAEYLTQAWFDITTQQEFALALIGDAWQQVVNQHDILRTGFFQPQTVGTTLHQVVLQSVDLRATNSITDIDLSAKEWSDSELETIRQQQLIPFDTTTPPLMRFAIVKVSPNKARVIWTHHHALLDGWSIPILFKQFSLVLNALLKQESVVLPEAPAYEHYIGWLMKQNLPAAQRWWRDLLRDVQPLQPLEQLLPVVSAPRNTAYQILNRQLDSTLTQTMEQLARHQSCTLSTIIQAGWALLLSRYQGFQVDSDSSMTTPIVFGTTVSGRPADLHGVEAMVGLFINTIPVCVSVEQNQSLTTLLNGLSQQQIARQSHEWLSLAQIQSVNESEPQSLFESLVVFENFPVMPAGDEQVSESSETAPEFIIEHAQSAEQTSYPLTLVATAAGEQLHVRLSFDGKRFNSASIAVMFEQLTAVLQQMTRMDAKAAINTIQLSATHSVPESNEDLSTTTSPLALARFSQFIDSSSVAIIDGDARFDWQTLEQQSNQLAHWLLEQSDHKQLIAIEMPRSADFIIAMLAVLKSGNAWLPIDPALPTDRKHYILNDAAVSLVLSNCSPSEMLDYPTGITAFHWSSSAVAMYPVSRPVATDNLQPDDLAYVIYTSGSTGKPKGVQIEHRQLARLLSVCQQDFEQRTGRGFDASDCWSWFHASSFDFSVWETWGALAFGGKLLVINAETARNPDALAAELIEHQVTVLNQTPSAFYNLLPKLTTKSADFSLRQIIFGGEALDFSRLTDWFEASISNNCQLINMYGITETTVHATLTTVTAQDATYSHSRIGRPLSDFDFCVLNAQQQPVATGIAGELYLSGPGVARGYLHRPELTAERFVTLPNRDGIWYRSGDKVAEQPDGSLIYLGRCDDQVKVRGYRIETGEVEARLGQCTGVTQAVVAAIKHPVTDVTFLMAWLQAESEQLLDINEVKAQLRQFLPDYMIPERLDVVERLPLTVNGKVDKKQLSAAVMQRLIMKGQEDDLHGVNLDTMTSDTPIALVESLHQIWSVLLPAETVGLDQNFFSAGGDSIIAVQLVARAKKAGINVSLRQLFDFPTINQLAAVVHRAASDADSPNKLAEQSALTGALSLLPIQHDFFAQRLAVPSHFNQAVSLTTPAELTEQQLLKTVAALYQRHDVLRLAFTSDSNEHIHHANFEPQTDRIIARALCVVPEALDNEAYRQYCDDAQASLDPTQADNCRFIWFVARQQLLVVMHHLVVDGVSWRILRDDIARCYQHLLEQPDVDSKTLVGEKTASLHQWQNALQHWQQHNLTEQLPFWLAQLPDKRISLPDHPNSTQEDSRSEQHDTAFTSLVLTTEQTAQLTQVADTIWHCRTHELLISALVIALTEWTHQADNKVVLTLEGHGRDSWLADSQLEMPDVSETLGWFTAIYPVAFDAVSELQAAVAGVKKQLRLVPDNGLGFGVLQYLSDHPELTDAASRLNDSVMFNFLGQVSSHTSDNTSDENHEEPLFTLASDYLGQMSSSQNRLSYPLVVNSIITDGQLSFSLLFDKAILREDFVEQLVTLLGDTLHKLAAETESQVSVSDFPLATLSQSVLTDWQQVSDVRQGRNTRTVSKLYPATPVQQGLLFHGFLSADDDAGTFGADYSTQTRVSMKGELDITRFKQALHQVVNHHDILKTAFIGFDEQQIHQVVAHEVDVPFFYHDWQNRDVSPQVLEQWLIEEKQQGFDFSAPPLMRIHLIQESTDQFHMIWTHHHALLDGWCLSLIFADVMQAYQQPDGVLPHRPDYQQYIQWLLQKQASHEGVIFWRDYLAPVAQKTALTPFIKPTAEQQTNTRQQIQSLTLSADVTAGLLHTATTNACTINNVFQAVVAAVLTHYDIADEQQSLVLGEVVSGRPPDITDVEEMVGLFISTVPVVFTVSPEQTLKSLILQSQRTALDRQQHAYVPLATIQQQAQQLVQGYNGQPYQDGLFDALLVFENYPVSDAIQQHQQNTLQIQQVNTTEQTNYPLTLIASCGNQPGISQFNLAVHFDEQIVDETMVQRFVAQLKSMFEQLAQPQMLTTALNESVILPDTQQQALIDAGIGEQLPEAPAKTVIGWFEQQVARTPNATAVICPHAQQQLSYLQLNERANQLAHWLLMAADEFDLKEPTSRTPQRVALRMSRRVELIIGMLACHKAGAAWIAIDPNYPTERQQFMLQDSQADVLLLDSSPDTDFSADRPSLNVCDERAMQAVHQLSTTTPSATLHGQDLAWLIYTSGSTGTPKGVCINQDNALALIQWAHHRYTPEQLACVAAVTSFCFDLSMFELFAPLTCGGCVALLQNGIDIYGYRALGEQLTLINTVPSVMKHLMDVQAETQVIADSVQIINLAGEPLPRKLVNEIYRQTQVQAVYNLYGPSEDTTYSTEHYVARDEQTAPAIGRPVAHTQTLVLDQQQRLVPQGVTGELWLSGRGLSAGYWQRPDLTTDKFKSLIHPVTGKSVTAYRTGDLVRWNNQLLLEFVGRIDHQVKLRGLRIELGEVAHQLTLLDDVQDCVVLVVEQDDGRDQLVACVQPVAGFRNEDVSQKSRTDKILRDQLKRSLPDYMVPEAWYYFSALPLTPNGKIDHKALRQQIGVQQRALQQQAFSAVTGEPGSDVERQLMALWNDLLSAPVSSVEQNFFAAGGDSILSIQLVSRAKKQGLQFSVKNLFDHPTIAELAQWLSEQTANEQQLAVEADNLTGQFDLLPIQQDFFARVTAGVLQSPSHYNQSLMLRTPSSLTVEQLTRLVGALIEKHDGLRQTFVQTESGWQAQYNKIDESWLARLVRVIDPSNGRDVKALYTQLKNTDENAAIWQQQFDIYDPGKPLFSLVYFPQVADDRSGRLLMICHHLIIDGVSWRVLINDMNSLLEGHTLSEKTHSIRQWQTWLAAALPAVASQGEYWQQQTDRSELIAPSDKLSVVHQVSQTLTAALTDQLLRDCHQIYNTSVNDVLLTALTLSWQHIMQQDSLTVEFEGHGRETTTIEQWTGQILDLSDTVGWFTSLYPVKLGVQSTVSETVKATKTTLASIPDQGMGFGILQTWAETPVIALSNDNGPDNQQNNHVLFNYLGQTDQATQSQQAKRGFTVVPESTGMPVALDNYQHQLLAINAVIAGGQLQFSVAADSSRLTTEQLEAFAVAYLERLEQVIQHCTQQSQQLAQGYYRAELAGFTPDDFPYAVASNQQLKDWQQAYPTLERVYRATPMQLGLLFHGLTSDAEAEETQGYITQTWFDFSGDIDIAAMESAWQQLVDRHDVLRTAFVGFDTESVHQLVLSAAGDRALSVPFTLEDWRDRQFTRNEREQMLADWRFADKQAGFDFAKPPLLRVTLIRLPVSPGENPHWQLVWTHHHVLLDGWCLPILFNELISHYHQTINGSKNNQLLTHEARYERYVGWLFGREQDSVGWWRDYLAGMENGQHLRELLIPSHQQPQKRQYQLLEFQLEASETARLQQLAARLNTTVNVMVQLGWAWLLHRYSGGESNLCFGATVSGRPPELSGVEQMIGLFINTVPVRAQVQPDQTIASVVTALHQHNIEREQHSYLSLADIQRQAGIAADGEASMLFDTLVVFENYPINDVVDSSRQQQQTFSLDAVTSDEQTNFPLTLMAALQQTRIDQSHEGKTQQPQSVLGFKLGWHNHLISTELATNLQDHLLATLATLSELSGGASLNQLPFILPAQQQLIDTVNDKAFRHGEALTPTIAVRPSLPHWLSYYAETTPEAIAIYSGEQPHQRQQISYQTLAQTVSGLAKELQHQGIGSGDVVALYARRDVELITGLLAVMSLQAVYLPVDPAYPAERIRFMLQDAKASLILHDAQFTAQNQRHQATWQKIQTVADELAIPLQSLTVKPEKQALKNGDKASPTQLTDDAIAYQIYTSGTTGQPKGVLLQQAALINTALAQQQILNTDTNSRILQFASVGFDASVIEIALSVVSGATLVMVDDDMNREPDRLTRYIANAAVTHATLPPALLAAMKDDPASYDYYHRLQSVQHLLVAGDSCALPVAQFWARDRNFYNAYGPTEITVCHSIGQFDLHQPDLLPIGYPIAGKQQWVVDENLYPVPPGVAGELVSGGVGVSPGYHQHLNDMQENQRKFVQIDQKRGYRTGDKVKQQSDGQLQFIGRVDNQVKLRGHRIEPAEVEAALRQLPGVADAAVSIWQPDVEKIASDVTKDPVLAAWIRPEQYMPSSFLDQNFSNVKQENARPAVELWPSIAEFFVYDEVLYRSMANDIERNQAYFAAMQAALPGKTVLEIGPGSELILTQMCIAAGASKVYAVELLPQTWQKARQKLAQLEAEQPDLAGKIVLLHGDATKITLPEQVDYCVSEIVGGIGGSEGAAKIINEIRHHLHHPANMIPSRTATKLAAVTLPDASFSLENGQYGFKPIAAHYTEQIFENAGKPFDLRLCVKHFPAEWILSSHGLLEDLDHTQFVPLETTHDLELVFEKSGVFHGFIAWLNLWPDANHVIDILEEDKSWLPVYFPVSLEGIPVKAGDKILGQVERKLHIPPEHRGKENAVEFGLNPDFFIRAILQFADGRHADIPVNYDAWHQADTFLDQPFYNKLFSTERSIQNDSSSDKVTAHRLPDNQPTAEQQQQWLASLADPLADRLPGWSIPSLFTPVSSMPLTVNGKIDYQALPEPQQLQQISDVSSPENDTERVLCDLWQTMLNQSVIGIDDNFFTLGGDSIISIQLVAQAKQQGLNFSVRQLFEQKTIRKLAALITAQAGQLEQSGHQAQQNELQGKIPLLPMQRLFFEHPPVDAHHFNQSVMLHAPTSLTDVNLRRMISVLASRHDALRTIFPTAQRKQNSALIQALTAGWVQQVLRIDAATELTGITAVCSDYQHLFSLEQGPLLRVIWFNKSGVDRIAIIAHHLIIDGVSWRILMNDLAQLWHQVEANQSQLLLADKTHAVSQWQAGLQDALAVDASDENHLLKQTSWWQQQLQQPWPRQLSDLPLLHDWRGEKDEHHQGQINISLTENDTARLLGQSNEAWNTQINELLLTALSKAWQQWSGHSVMRLALEHHGREADFMTQDVTETIGWFTALYPLVLHWQPALDISENVKLVKELHRSIPDNGVGYQVLAAQDDTLQQLAAEPCETSVVFNYLGQFGQEQNIASNTAHPTPFSFAAQATGPGQSEQQSAMQLFGQHHLLAINAMVSGEPARMNFTINADPAVLSAARLQQFADALNTAVTQVIEACQQRLEEQQLFEANSNLILSITDVSDDDAVEMDWDDDDGIEI